MIHHATQCVGLIAARQDSYRVWGRFDHGRPGFGATEMLLIAGAAALLIFGALTSYWLAKRRKRDFWSNNSSRLFQEFSRAHRLSLANRRLMKQLAAARGADNPSLLFVEPEYFDLTNLPSSLKSAAGDLRELRHELFG